MPFPEPYIQFLVHFHGDRDFFECHEILEDFWKEKGMRRDSIWMGFIQIAVCFYHYRRGNLKGAQKLVDKVLVRLKYKKKEVQAMGIHYRQLIQELKKSKENINAKLPYQPINLPIDNNELLHFCMNECKKRGYPWGQTRENSPDYIIHKHKIKMRTSNIQHASIEK